MRVWKHAYSTTARNTCDQKHAPGHVSLLIERRQVNVRNFLTFVRKYACVGARKLSDRSLKTSWRENEELKINPGISRKRMIKNGGLQDFAKTIILRAN